MDGRFEPYVSCLLEGLPARKGLGVGPLSQSKGSDPQEDLAVHQSEPGDVLRARSPRHTSAHQGLSHLRLLRYRLT